jgi:ribosome biogenesis GTPase
MEKKITLEDLGYNDFFKSDRKKLKLDNFEIARVIAEYKEAYRVKSVNGEYFGKITGKQIFKASTREDYPAVGDWVAISVPDNEHAVIRELLPRKTIIKRRGAGKNETQVIAANVDVVFVVQALDKDYSLNRFERYFAIAKDGGVKPAIILNKADLASREELESKRVEIKERFVDADFILTSTVTNDGLEKLESYMQAGMTYCFLGSSARKS